jgi:hypothetical protein
MANRKPNDRLVLAAAMCGPHLTYANAIEALRNHPNPKIRALACSCSRKALENRLRRYQTEMKKRAPSGIEFMDGVAAVITRLATFAELYMPGDDSDCAAVLAEAWRVAMAMNEAASIR